MTRRLGTVVALAAVLLVSVIGWVIYKNFFAGVVIHVGVAGRPGHELLYLAREKGFYKEQGVAVKLVELTSLSDLRHAFEEGRIDIMASTMTEAIVASENTQQPVKLIAVTGTSAGADALLVKANSGLDSLADLKGKKIGVETATVNIVAVASALKSVGAKVGDVLMMAGAPDELLAQFESGQLDALQTYPPFSTQLMQSGNYKILVDSAAAPGQLLEILASNTSFKQQHLAEIKLFLNAYSQAVDYLANHQQDAVELLAKHSGISAQAQMARFNQVQLYDKSRQLEFFNGGSAGAGFRNTIDVLVEAGVLKTKLMGSDFIDLDIY